MLQFVFSYTSESSLSFFSSLHVSAFDYQQYFLFDFMGVGMIAQWGEQSSNSPRVSQVVLGQDAETP